MTKNQTRRSIFFNSLLPLLLVLTVYSYIYFLNSWLSDDWYIALRQVRNFVNGHGIVWNLGERVQTFTCPLWVMIYTPVYAIFREEFFTTLTLQYMLGLLFFFQSRFFFRSNKKFLLFSICILFSSGFTDYFSGGTESALTILLTACWLYNAYNHKNDQIALICASLLIFNRLDHILLVSPWLLSLIISKHKQVKVVLGYQFPWLLWIAFSIIYFGLPLPTTFYSKLSNGVAFQEKLQLGFYYLLRSFEYDPLFFIVISLGVYKVIKHKQWQYSGAIAYLIYLVIGGGDFMACRLLTPVYLSLLIIIFLYSSTKHLALLALVLFLAMFAGEKHPFVPIKFNSTVFLKNGIANEKSYHAQLGNSPYFRLYLKSTVTPDLEGQKKSNKNRMRSKNFILHYTHGQFGYLNNENLYILDPSGIGTPYMLFLPIIEGARQGHFVKRVPRELIGFIRDKDEIKNKQYRKVINHWNNIFKLKLFSLQRWKSIWFINTFNPKKELRVFWDNTHFHKWSEEDAYSIPVESTDEN